MPRGDQPDGHGATSTISWGYVAVIVIGMIVAIAIICTVATVGGRQKYKSFAAAEGVVTARA